MKINSFKETTPKHGQEFIGITNYGSKAVYIWEHGAPRKLKPPKCNYCKQRMPLSEGEYLIEWY